MPSLLVRPNRTGALRLAVGEAWRTHADPAERVACVLKSFPGFIFTLRAALRRAGRHGNKLYLDGFGLYIDEAHVLSFLTQCASRDAWSFYTMLRDLQILVDARNRVLRKLRRG